jgi:predicted transcriptional regulator
MTPAHVAGDAIRIGWERRRVVESSRFVGPATATATDLHPGTDQPLPSAVLKRAEELYAVAHRRARTLGTMLFGDPAWHIMLDLLISAGRGSRLSVTAVCIGSLASPGTAHRYLALLVEEGLVERTADATDRRRSHVRLTPHGVAVMIGLLDPIT